MKKLLIFVSAMFFIATVQSQNCSNVFISEVVFGIDTMQSSQTIIKNYSVELFNPTDQPIDLADYSFNLIADNGLITGIQLSGIVESKKTYVISYDQAGSDLYLLTDLINSNLNFDNKKVLELMKNAVVIDRVGKYGLANSDLIDVIQAIGDPAAYLNSLNFDFRSLQKLTFRRNPTVKQGDLLFADPSHQWLVFANNDISEIDTHMCVCANYVVFGWDAPKYIGYEGGYIFPVINATGWDGSTFPSVDAWLHLNWTPSGFTPPSAYANSADGIVPNIISCVFMNSSYTIQTTSDPDGIPEPDESAFYELCFASSGTSIDPANKYTEIVIKSNNGYGIHDSETSEAILKTFPNPVNENLFIRLSDNNKSDKIILFDITGNKVLETNLPTTFISMKNFPSGLYLLFVKVGEEIYTKRISKL